MTVRWQSADAAIRFIGPGVRYEVLPLPASWMRAMMRAAKCPDVPRRIANYEMVLKQKTDALEVLEAERPDLLPSLVWIAAAVAALDTGARRRGENLLPLVRECRLPTIYKVSPTLYGGVDALPQGWKVTADMAEFANRQAVGIRMAPDRKSVV